MSFICACCHEPIEPKAREVAAFRTFLVHASNIGGRNYCYACWPLARLMALGTLGYWECKAIADELGPALADIGYPGKAA